MQFPLNETVLFFSPHCDDEAISAGALLSTLSKRNNVIVYYLTNSPKGVARDLSDEQKIKLRQQEARNACKIIGCVPEFLNLDNSFKEVDHELEVHKENLTLIKEIIDSKNPSLVLTLYENESHPTHRKTTKLVKEAISRTDTQLWFGEAWAPILNPNDAYFFNDDVMEIKTKALSCYKSQIERTDWMEATKNLNSYRAITLNEVLGGFGSVNKSKGKYAEAFLLEH